MCADAHLMETGLDFRFLGEDVHVVFKTSHSSHKSCYLEKLVCDRVVKGKSVRTPNE